MEKIQMVDLKSQYEKIQDEIDNAVLDVVRSTQYINGPEVKKFQQDLEEYLDVSHVIPCANGTDALQVAMMGLDLKPGDEVITTSFTFVATVEVIALLGLTPVLVDVYEGTFNMNTESVRKAITPRTKAIVPVHLFGQCVNMEEIMSIAKKHNLYVIEDNAQAIGADYIFSNGKRKKAGTIGHVGCTSFFPSKNLGCYGDGGAIFTDNEEIAEKIRIIVNHGMVVRYYHDYIGVNSRLDSIQAAILRVKLKYLDKYAKLRREAADYYDNAFADNAKLIIPERSSFSTHVFHQYTLKTRNIDRDKLKKYLGSKNIPAMIYYPVPMHEQNAYKNYEYKKEDLSITDKLSKSVISLPMHTELSKQQQDYIISHVLDFVNNQ